MKKQKIASFIVFLALSIAMTGMLFTDTKEKTGETPVEVRALVLEVNNDNVYQQGVARIGAQKLKIKILKGQFKGNIVNAENAFLGQLEIDNAYEVNDKIIAAINVKDGELVSAKAIDLYRQGDEFLLFAIFVVLLLVFAGLTGLKAIFSFIASLIVLWKLLIPGLLDGKSPLLLASLVIVVLSAVIIFSVGGFTKKALSAFLGTICGLLITIVLTVIFGNRLGLLGMTQPFAQALFFSGNMELNMMHILYGSIIIGASGAAMDISMDVSASMQEVKLKKQDISFKELIKSGFNVGKAVIGTMTTTLLLAYTGGYLTLLMLFYSKESSFVRMMNLKIVAAEVMRTLIGSIGLVMVAPITAFFAALLLTGKNNKSGKKDGDLTL